MRALIRILGPGLTGALVAALLVTLPAASAQDPTQADAVTAPTVTERPDAVSAMVTAQAQGSRVEDLSQRTESTLTFANPDGTWSTEMASGPVRVREDDGSWADIDTTLERNGTGGWVPRAAAAEMTFSDGGGGPFVTMQPVGDSSFALTWPDALPAPVVEGATLTYRNVVPHGDLVVQALPGGFSHSIVLREAPTAAVQYRMPLTLDGLEMAKESNGALSVRKPTGKQVASAPKPLMFDREEGPEAQADTVTALGATIEGTGADTELVLTPDMEMLQDPDTQYPVTIDPTFSKTPFRDTWIQNADYTSGQTGSTQLRAGTYDGGGHKARSFIDFDAGALKGKHILSATLKLRNFYSGSCTSRAIRVNAISESWDKTNITWGNQPGVYPGHYDDYAQAFGYTGCPDAGWATWNVKDMVTRWSNRTWVNRGIRVRAVDETSIHTWRKYRSANYSNANMRPHLVVDYNSYPNKPGVSSVSPVAGSSSTGLVTRDATPTFKAKVSDPDSGKLRGYFEVHTGGNRVWYKESGLVSSGSTASVTVPNTKPLSHGTTYTVKAWGDDDIDRSKNASSTIVTVDTQDPATPGVTATDFTDGSWTDPAPGSNTFTFTSTAGDVTSFSYTKDDGALGTISADTAGKATLDWNPPDGAHTLKVEATDRAGNTSSITTFNFGVSRPAFAVPRPGEGSLGVFRLEPAAQSGASSMTLEWRHAGETTWNPASEVTTESGSAWSGTTVDSGTLSTPGVLLWDASQQTDPDTGKKLSAPRLLEVQACFTYTSTSNPACSDPLLVQLDDGFGPEYATTNLGPATVALLKGAMTLPAADAGTGAVALGRVWSTAQAAEATDGPFGRGWQTASLGGGASETTVEDNRGIDGSFVISYATGGDEKFLTQSGSTETYVPVDTTNTVTKLDLDTSATPATLRLTENTDTTTPTVTTWHHDATSNTWVLDAVDAPGDAIDVAVSSTGDRITWLSQVPAGSSATCTATTQAEGCRGLLLDYDANSHIKSVTEKVHATGSTSTQSSVVATYAYTAGMLTEACGPDPDGAGPNTSMCVSYQYDTTRAAPRLTSVTPPGQTKWRYSYDIHGRITGAKRALTSGNGDASWAIDYDVSLSTPGLPDMSASAATEWGQSVIPTKVYAVYTPQADGGASTADPTQAQLYYTEADGSVTNTAAYGPDGWLVDTGWLDQYGNVVRSLDGPGWARVQNATASDRPEVARDASSFVVYNESGDRIEEEYGPVITATLDDGTTGPFRSRTTYTYDDEEPTLGGPKPSGAVGAYNLVVEERSAATDPNMAGTDYGPTVTRYEYDPVVTGDGDGWELGMPTRVKTLNGTEWSTEVTRYDTDGNVIETRQPGATDTTGAGSDAHSRLYVYYTSGPSTHDSDCGNKPGWEGLLCKTKPAGQPTGPTIPVTWNKSYTDDLMPNVIQETSGPTVRTTTTTYDGLGRPTGVEKVVTGGNPNDPVLPTSTITYNDQSQQATVSAGGKTITTTYDDWGRQSEYTDALGNRSTTTYNPAGAVDTFNDGAGTYAYSYTTHGLLNSVDVGSSGAFAYQYTRTGQVDEITYPNGLVADYTVNEAGVPTDLVYSQGAETLLTFGATVDVFGRTSASSSTASAQQYIFDSLGRITRTEDTRDGGCTTRTYGFDASSNRTNLTSYGPDVNGECQQTTASTSQVNSFDAAGRIRNIGYTYDDLGRTRSIPRSDTFDKAIGDLTATYYADDMIASLSQTVDDGGGGSESIEVEYSLDPAERISTIAEDVDDVERSRTRYLYSGSSDSPSVVEVSTDSGTSWVPTRYMSIPGLGMVGSIVAGTTTLHLRNLHGDIVATQANTQGSIDSYSETDEFGNPVGDSAPSARYGWLGAFQRSTETVGGMTLMGHRVYNPTTGLFQSEDQVWQGNDTRYAYPNDPINSVDLDGLRKRAYWWGGWKSYHPVGPNYIRIWINKLTMYKLARFAGYKAKAAFATGVISTAFAAFSRGSARRVMAKAAAVAGLLALYWQGLSWGLKKLARNNHCLALKVYVAYGWPVAGYPYLSTYGCRVGGRGRRW